MIGKGWVKTFLNDSYEEGSDHMVDSELASWRGGRQRGIRSVTTYNGQAEVIIACNTEGTFWQSDTWTMKMGASPERAIRRIQ